MPIASGTYFITNAKQRNRVFLENPNDEEPIRGNYKLENPIKRVSPLPFLRTIRASREPLYRIKHSGTGTSQIWRMDAI
jgi:hypothetical protein